MKPDRTLVICSTVASIIAASSAVSRRDHLVAAFACVAGQLHRLHCKAADGIMASSGGNSSHRQAGALHHHCLCLRCREKRLELGAAAQQVHGPQYVGSYLCKKVDGTRTNRLHDDVKCVP